MWQHAGGHFIPKHCCSNVHAQALMPEAKVTTAAACALAVDLKRQADTFANVLDLVFVHSVHAERLSEMLVYEPMAVLQLCVLQPGAEHASA